MKTTSKFARPKMTGLGWKTRALLAFVILVAGICLWFANSILLSRFSEAAETRAELRLEGYKNDILETIRRNGLLPELLATDPVFLSLLESQDLDAIKSRMNVFAKRETNSSFLISDQDGVILATVPEGLDGARVIEGDAFTASLLDDGPQFTVQTGSGGNPEFIFSQSIRENADLIGMVFSILPLQSVAATWSGEGDAVAVFDAQGRAILATDSLWLNSTETEMLNLRSADSAIRRANRLAQNLPVEADDPFVRGREVVRRELDLGFQGWRIIGFSTLDGVRQQVNGALALVLTFFAFLLALIFFFSSRSSALQALGFQRESEELKTLNARLQNEISGRQRAEKELQVAEQTIEQSSKLAALGEMAAAVSHELNQPLSAMRTYLAGAKMLLERSRTNEALSSFQRIDDLIGRMGSITGQLKTHARKGGEDHQPVNVEDAINGALEIMGMAFSENSVALTRTFPPQNVYILGDQARLEQVLINLFRNALDAMKERGTGKIDVLLVVGNEAKIVVRDDGPGIENLDDLFEPFYTTKTASEGVGLGLAISSGIISDFGGGLSAFNGEPKGAVFEIVLPIMSVSEKS